MISNLYNTIWVHLITYMDTNMDTIFLNCELCNKNVQAEDTIDLNRETEQHKETLISCETCFVERLDTLRKEGWDVDQYTIQDEDEEGNEQEEITEDFTFTQYLYSADDIRQAIATNILLKNKEKAQFWINELVHSLLIDLLVGLLWNIYFTYYFPLNPEFYNYLLKQTKRIREAHAAGNEQIPDLVNAANDIAANLMLRPFTMDVLLEGMRTDANQLPCFFGQSHFPERDVMNTDEADNIIAIVAGDNIATTNRKKTATLFRNLDKLRNTPKKIGIGVIYVPIEVECAARKALLIAYATKQKMGKNIFAPPSNIPLQQHCEVRATKTLETYTTISMSDELSFCPIDTPITDEWEMIHGASHNIIDAFRQHWEYYAYRAPLWGKRIDMHQGTPDHHTKRIIWNDDDLQEQFYEAYGYDTDELDSDITKRCIAINKRRLTASEYCDMIINNSKKN